MTVQLIAPMVLITVTVVALTGCGGGKPIKAEDRADTASVSVAAPVKVPNDPIIVGSEAGLSPQPPMPTFAQRAVDAAKTICAGKTVSIMWEAGLQSADPIKFSGPEWEQLTGCKIKVVEVPTLEMSAKIMREYRAGTGVYDAMSVIPSWMPELVQAGALEQLDSFVDKYGFRADLQEVAPGFRDNWMTVNGKIYGFPDDGDVFLMYYRKDIFARSGLQEDFKARYGYDLAPPKTWQQFDQIGSFLTEKLKDEGIYGASLPEQPTYTMFMFQERFRNEGGKFFEPNTMRATVNSPIGVRVFTEMRNQNRFMPPGVEKFGFVENLAVFLKGASAMTISWPAYGRFAAGYLAGEKYLDWVPKSKIARRVGYALPPGGHPELAAGSALSVASTSRQKEQAYLFIQWLNSDEISNQRVQLPYTLRDPFRNSHYTNPEYVNRWPDAGDYLKALEDASKTGLLDLSLIQTEKYEEALRWGIARLWVGEEPKGILDDVAKQWDEITLQVGVNAQRAVYTDWVSKPGAYPK